MALEDILRNITLGDAIKAVTDQVEKLTSAEQTPKVPDVPQDKKVKIEHTRELEDLLEKQQLAGQRFLLKRVEDASGVSGTGYVASGYRFPDGTAVMRWNTSTASTAIYGSTDDLLRIHGHEGRTRIEWLDK